MAADRLLFVYKYYPFDPTLHATLKWLPRLLPHVGFFRFEEHERGKRYDDIEPNPRYLDAVSKFTPTHIWAWNCLVNQKEVDAAKSRGIKVSALMNSFGALHLGHIAQQDACLKLLR